MNLLKNLKKNYENDNVKINKTLIKIIQSAYIQIAIVLASSAIYIVYFKILRSIE